MYLRLSEFKMVNDCFDYFLESQFSLFRTWFLLRGCTLSWEGLFVSMDSYTGWKCASMDCTRGSPILDIHK